MSAMIVATARSMASLPLRKCGLKLVVAKIVIIFRILSLPLRKCGLKSHPSLLDGIARASLALRKCGLKSYGNACSKRMSESLPLRKCGLK